MATATSAAGKNNRGKDQIHWSEGVWTALDHAVMEEMMRTRVAAKFLPHVHVDRKQTNVASDIVIVPGTPGAPPVVAGDVALSVDESAQSRIQEYWTTFRLSVAQVEEEEHEEITVSHHTSPSHPEEPATMGHPQGHMSHPHGHMSHAHRASTGVSLAMRAANILAQAEDLVIFNGANAVVSSPLFAGRNPLIQFLDQKLLANLDSGLLNIKPLFNGPPVQANLVNNDIQLQPSQVFPVHPTAAANGVFPPTFAENTLNAVAAAFSAQQGQGHYEHYALALHTVPYADLHQALKTTLIEPVEPISHLIKAGVHGTGTLPPFSAYPPPPGAAFPPPLAQILATGLPTSINGGLLATANPDPTKADTSPITGFVYPIQKDGTKLPIPNVLYTGVLVSLSGNTMDHVRGHMDDQKDAIVVFNQKDTNEQYRFRVVQRFALRLKDPTAVTLLLFLDS
jgi:hypothetical protein